MGIPAHQLIPKLCTTAQNIFLHPLPFTGEGQPEGAFSTVGQGEGYLQNFSEISPLVTLSLQKLLNAIFAVSLPKGES
ncbi:hypothetical protein A1D22_05165 [Pasteurellaceae bacterium LFhippo2]|nr:hypothetical protein [Pasteurellaceae bacterium LFhippo2]